MEETEVVTCFLRHGAGIVLFRRSANVGSYEGMWGAVAGHAEGDPDAAAREEIREETGLDPARDVTFVRRGDPFPVTDEDLGTRWVVHPYLFECETPDIETNWETETHEWVAPTAILHRETVPGLWSSYDRVRPTVTAVAEDREHGSAYISVRALEVLRDEAAVRASTATLEGTVATDGPILAVQTDGWDDLADIAVSLREARPSMPVVRNRVDRVLAAASDARTPSAVEHAATAGITDALDADDRAGANAARHIAGDRVATLSRSGTVQEALSLAEPEAVLVAESRPGGEGVGVAEAITRETDAAVTLTTDAAFPQAISDWDADAVLVGADAICPDGAVVNKTGTRAAAFAGIYEGIDVLIVAASDKVTPHDRTDLKRRDTDEIYDGDADLTVYNPTFDVTPPECVDAVVTEHGPLDWDGVAAVAADHRSRADWPES